MIIYFWWRCRKRYRDRWERISQGILLWNVWRWMVELQKGVENEMEEEGNGEKYCFVQGRF